MTDLPIAEGRKELVEFALELAHSAEGEILRRFRNCVATIKADGTEVTDADRAAEEAMRTLIASRYPRHAILGEEFGAEGGADAVSTWVLDPIDGTASFVLGIPIFGTLVGFLEKGEPTVGVIHFPGLGETVWGVKGGGCWFRERESEPVRLRVSDPVALSGGSVSASGLHASTVDPRGSHANYDVAAVVTRARRFRFVADCFQHALVCRGTLDAAIDTVMKPWDIAAVVPCVEEAGGIVTNLRGERDDIVNAGSLLSSSNREIHDELLTLLRI